MDKSYPHLTFVERCQIKAVGSTPNNERDTTLELPDL